MPEASAPSQPTETTAVRRTKLSADAQLQTTESQRDFLESLAPILKVRELDHWHHVSHGQLKAAGAEALLVAHGGSPLALLQALYPQHSWLPWRHADGVPARYWLDTKNQRKFLDWYAEQAGIQEWEQWYAASYLKVKKRGGATLLGLYNNSVSTLIQTVYSQHDWKPWKFQGGVPRGYWDDTETHRLYLDWLAGELGYTKWQDWYDITLKKIHKYYGGGLVARYGSSPSLMICKVYPQHPWLPWRFVGGVPAGYWDDMQNQQKFVENLARELNIEHWEDWYKVSQREILATGGAGHILKTLYNGSHYQMLQAVYPQHTWLPWLFEGGVPDGSWTKIETVKMYFDWLIQDQNLSGPVELAKKSAVFFKAHRGTGVFSHYPKDTAFRLAYPGRHLLAV